MLKVLNYLTKYNVNSKKPIVVSVSGGVDSISLLHLLNSYNYKVIAVHFNHHTRDNNKLEAELVENYAKKLKIKYYYFDIKIESGNFQSEARNIRYNHLKDVALENKTTYIATAHHLDDLAETVLMRITRGSNLYGYAGIHDYYEKDNFIYLKPLLNYSKVDIIKYANNYNLEYYDDYSNYLDLYTRNRIRNTVVPILKQENNNFLKKVSDYNTILKNSFIFIRKYAHQFIVDNQIDIERLLQEETIIQDEVLNILLEEKNIEVNFNLLNDLKSILKSHRPNLNYDLGNDYLLIKSYNVAFVQKNTEIKPFKVVLNKDSHNLPNMKNITFLADSMENPKNSVKICYNKLSLPLIARSRENGDMLQFAFGSKKLKDFFIDKKVPKNLRDELTIITDQDNLIVYVENYYINETLGKGKEIFLQVNDLNKEKR